MQSAGDSGGRDQDGFTHTSRALEQTAVRLGLLSTHVVFSYDLGCFAWQPDPKSTKVEDARSSEGLGPELVRCHSAIFHLVKMSYRTTPNSRV